MTSRYPRLTMVDRTNLAIETSEAPMHIGALAVVEGTRLLDAPRQLQLSEVRRQIGLRLSHTPELRRRVYKPGLFGAAPLWIDDPGLLDRASRPRVRRSAAGRGGPTARSGRSPAASAPRQVPRGPRAPRTSLNRPIRAGRVYRVIRFDLAALKAVAHARAAKVNDVVLTIVASELRDLLVHRGEQVDV